jgi:hypothetical protein
MVHLEVNEISPSLTRLKLFSKKEGKNEKDRHSWTRELCESTETCSPPTLWPSLAFSDVINATTTESQPTYDSRVQVFKLLTARSQEILFLSLTENAYPDSLLFLGLTEYTYPNELDVCNHRNFGPLVKDTYV